MKKLTLLAVCLFSIKLVLGQNNFYQKLSNAAVAITANQVTYDPAYFIITYPNGDVPANKGVCTDVVIRAYRKLNIDLQKLVHEDMIANFNKYPKLWGLKKTDTNIDHRRVPNLMTFFERRKAQMPISTNASAYLAGDIVCWRLPNNKTHIGIVINKLAANGKTPLMVHNIGAGQVIEDCLFNFKIIGHYRYSGY